MKKIQMTQKSSTQSQNNNDLIISDRIDIQNRTILIGDVLEQLRKIPNDSIDCEISSPPYWALRNYGVEGQWGLESTFQEYLEKMKVLMRELKRVLKPSGTCWINLGDCYGTHSSGQTNVNPNPSLSPAKVMGYEKSRIGIPERFYVQSIDDGWIARNHIPWVKSNPMPSSVKDRFTNTWESIFFFAKNQKYYFNLNAVREKPKTQTKPFNLRIREAKKGKGQLKLGDDPRAWKATNQEFQDHNEKGERIREKYEDEPHSTKARLHRTRPGNPNNKQDSTLGSDGKPKSTYEGFNERWVQSQHNVTNLDADSEGYNPMGKNPGDVFYINPKPFPEAHFACISEDTEIWSKNGWKNIDTLCINDEILTFDISNEKLHYHKPYGIYKYNYKGKLIHITNHYTDQLVTPNHRVLLKNVHNNITKRVDKNWQYVNAEDIKPYSGIRIPLSGYYDEKISLQLSDYFVELLGWIICEGHYKKNTNKIEIYQSVNANPSKVERIKTCLTQINFPFIYKEQSKDYNYKKSKQLISTMAIFTISNEYSIMIKNIIPTKKLTIQLLTELSQSQLNILYEALIGGDGHRRKDGRDCWIQKDKEQLDLFQILCHKIGKRTFYGSRKDAIYVTNRNDCQIHQSDFNECYKKVDYEGRVWCPNVPNTNFVAKRNNKIFITGNTFPIDLPLRILRCACPQQVCVKCGKPREPILKPTKDYQNYLDSIKGLESGNLEIGYQNYKNKTQSTTASYSVVDWTQCECNVEFKPGIVLDPFFGAGTCGVAAEMLGLNWIGIELKEEYTKIARKRLEPFKNERIL